MEIGVKVSAPGPKGIAFGVIVPTPPHTDWTTSTTVIRWDSPKEEYDEWQDFPNLHIENSRYQLTHIDDEGNPR